MADTPPTSDELMLSTDDNPFSPFTQFIEWLAFDTRLGYNTLSLLDRVSFTSLELSEADQDQALTDAMNEIVEINASGVHRLVKVQDFE